MNKQLLKASAVAAALLPVSGFAAIDDQGMQYVSASEGLNGSLRVDILLSTDDEANAPENDTDTTADQKVLVGGAENSLRLWVNGSSDLGGGLSSTYYWEMRNDGGTVTTHSWDLGLSGPWGEAEFGRLAMVAYRLVPSASLAFERGTERASPGSDPGDNGLRYESPSMNGFKFGVSGIVADVEDINDDAADEYSFAVSYDSPIGLQVGAGYEVVNLPEGTSITVAVDQANTILVANVADDKAGWRFGTRYSQDNWLVGYEYRSYEGFWDYGTEGTLVYDPNGDETDASTGVTVQSIDFNNGAEYDVHAFGVQVKIDRITASANYSKESQVLVQNVRDDSNDGGNAVNALESTELNREVFAVDMAYSLGSRSTMVVGWRSTETDGFTEANATDIGNNQPRNGLMEGDKVINGTTVSKEKSEVYLFYRVDF